MDVMEIISRIDTAFANDDYRAAFEIAKPYAEQGHAWAQTCIGSLYQCGLGVNMDLHEAERYFREAAEQGYAGAWYSLGVLYEVGGEDFPDDLEKAKQYYQKASNLGYFPGQPYTAPK